VGGGKLLCESGIFDRDYLYYLRAMRTIVDASFLLPQEALSAGAKVEQLGEEAKKGYCIVSGMLLPALSNTFVRDAETKAMLRNAIIALAIERWRLANADHVPDSLASLVPTFLPAIPEDPFDGKPLKYKPSAHGYIVYSVGRDAVDDGGVDAPPKGKSKNNPPLDIVLAVER